MNISQAAANAIVQAAPAFKYGGSWAVMPLNADTKGVLEELASEKDNFLPVQVKEGLVVHIDADYLLKNIRAVIGGGNEETFKGWADRAKSIAASELERFYKIVVADKTKSGKPQIVAIYSDNESGYLVDEGVKYPAFRLPFNAIARYVNVVVDGKVISGEQFAHPSSFGAWKDAMKKSSAGHGVLVRVVAK